jgi:hypothetical protein
MPQPRLFLRPRLLAVGLAVVACGAALGCGSHVDPNEGQTSSDLAPDTLLGHWDVLGSALDGATRTGTVDVAADRLDVAFGDYELHFVDGPGGASARWVDRSGPGAATVADVPITHTPAALGAGIVPLSLGGAWTLRDRHRPQASCHASLATDSLTTRCDDVKVQPDVLDWELDHPYPDWAWTDWPYWEGTPPAVDAWYQDYLRFVRNEIVPSPNGEMVGTRVETFASSFGDLGGKWELAGTGGAFCIVTLRGATLTSDCSGIDGDESQSDANGKLIVRFSRGLASGYTSKGIELTARRASR